MQRTWTLEIEIYSSFTDCHWTLPSTPLTLEQCSFFRGGGKIKYWDKSIAQYFLPRLSICELPSFSLLYWKLFLFHNATCFTLLQQFAPITLPGCYYNIKVFYLWDHCVWELVFKYKFFFPYQDNWNTTWNIQNISSNEFYFNQ